MWYLERYVMGGPCQADTTEDLLLVERRREQVREPIDRGRVQHGLADLAASTDR